MWESLEVARVNASCQQEPLNVNKPHNNRINAPLLTIFTSPTAPINAAVPRPPYRPAPTPHVQRRTIISGSLTLASPRVAAVAVPPTTLV